VILVSHDRALLRALTTRVWVLHRGHITDFPGSFEEWETASAERAHAASVAASEEEALRRVHERKQTRRTEETQKKQQESVQRAARRALEEAELRVTECEGQVAAIRGLLEDPSLYATPEGASEAHELAAQLEASREELEQALQAWEAASAAAEETN